LVLLLVITVAIASPIVTLRSAGNTRITFSITNPTQYSIDVLKWGTPFEGIRSNMFNIHDYSARPLEYLGMLVRRGAIPLVEEYLTIPANSEQSITIDLANHYDFTKLGNHVVSLNLPFYSGARDFEAETNAIELLVTKLVPRQNTTNGVMYKGCTNAQNNDVDNAVAGSITESRRSYNCMSARSCDAQSVKWFGVYSKTRFDYDRDRVFRAIDVHLSGNPFRCECFPPGCGSNVYAYVYPTDRTFTVYLCNLFFTLPKERVNTIVHEMSHFTSLGATDDYAYGKTECEALARRDPDKAYRNADNVCYFSETV